MIEAEYEKFEYQQFIDARLCAVIYTANGVKKKDNTYFDVKDFLPDQKAKKEKMTPEQYELMMLQKTIALGGQVNFK